jgi:hypothetical protein
MLTMRNWMFIKQFSVLREWLLATYDLRMLGDVDRGAFDEVPNELLAAVMSVVRSVPPSGVPSVAMQPTPLDDKSYDRERTKRKRAAVLCQVGRFEFGQTSLAAIETSPLVYWWDDGERERYRTAPKLGEVSPIIKGITTCNNVRFVRFAWEVERTKIAVSRFDRDGDIDDAEMKALMSSSCWVPWVDGAQGQAWCEPLDTVLYWSNRGLQIATAPINRYGRGESFYFLPGIAFSMIGTNFVARRHRYRSVIGNKGASVYPADPASSICLLNSAITRGVLQSLNPGMGFEVGDVARVPLRAREDAASIAAYLDSAFLDHERHRETSVEFHHPGASSWVFAQSWAQGAVDNPVAAGIPPRALAARTEPPTDHLSFALGVALGRFGAAGEGILTDAPATALPHGILFLSDASDDDSLTHAAAAPIHAAWGMHGATIDDKRTLKNYLQDKFFPDVHRKMYENRPIYFPLSSAKKAFVAYVSIHRWTAGTLNDLLAEHLYPAKKRLEGEVTDLRAARDGADKKASKAAEKRFGEVGKWLEELTDFIAAVELCAEKGPPPPDNKTTPRAADARYAPDLDDGVMINSAALWPLLEPQWKDPKKWWRELANADGKKDYDWSHLAARYFPDRVDAKCKLDPSLAVAHGCFWKYHPVKAYQWELRLQDEIRPDFTLDEPASDAARAAFEADHAETARELVTKEHLRRQRKKAKADGAAADDDDAPQGSLDLSEPEDEDADA